MNHWQDRNCFYIVWLHLKKDAPTPTDWWIADCWGTMGEWMLDHPQATEAECDKQWDLICMRPEGDPFKVIGAITFLEV